MSSMGLCAARSLAPVLCLTSVWLENIALVQTCSRTVVTTSSQPLEGNIFWKPLKSICFAGFERDVCGKWISRGWPFLEGCVA